MTSLIDRAFSNSCITDKALKDSKHRHTLRTQSETLRRKIQATIFAQIYSHLPYTPTEKELCNIIRTLMLLFAEAGTRGGLNYEEIVFYDPNRVNAPILTLEEISGIITKARVGNEWTTTRRFFANFATCVYTLYKKKPELINSYHVYNYNLTKETQHLAFDTCVDIDHKVLNNVEIAAIARIEKKRRTQERHILTYNTDFMQKNNF